MGFILTRIPFGDYLIYKNQMSIRARALKKKANASSSGGGDTTKKD